MNWKTPSLHFSDLILDSNEIYLNLGFSGTAPDAHFVEMTDQIIQEIREFCKPQAGYCIYPCEMPDDKYLVVDNQNIKVGQVITKYLKGCSHVAAFVVTAGIEFDEYCNRFKTNGDILNEFIAYSIGTEIAEAAVRFVTEKIASEAAIMQMHYTHAYCPGYCSWHVREQENLFKLFPENPCGVMLTDSHLMFPEKTVSGIIGLGMHATQSAHACDICGMVQCFKRKVS